MNTRAQYGSAMGWRLDAGADAFRIPRRVAEWTPEAVTFFFDNEVVGKVTAAKNPWLVSSFPTSVNMRLHYAVGGAYWGPPNASTKFPADYMVDYVRVWARP